MHQPNTVRERENFDYYDAHCPEGKMELAGGRLIVGNGLDGSRLLLDHILRGWGLDAATALGSIEQWLAALRELYGPIGGVDDELRSAAWRAPDVTAGSQGTDGGHRRVCEHLRMSFFEVGEELGGQALGGIVMRLGDNGFTPDVMFYKGDGRNTIYDSYLQGPAEMVIEVVRPAHRDYDYRVKREYYASGGVPEYLIIDPERRHFELLRLVRGSYAIQQPDVDGRYRPPAIPGLAIETEHLWPEGPYMGMQKEHNPFIVEQRHPDGKRRAAAEDSIGWGDLPFEPKLDLQPVPVLFSEYVCWAPESKFEFWDGRIQISGEEGVRNVTGLLLATLGLVEACRFAPPTDWIAALRRRRDREAHDGEIRREWRDRAARAADLLRSKYQPERIAITGSLLSTEPLSFWSQPAVAIWGVSFEHMQVVYKELSAMDIDVFEGDDSYFQRRVVKGEFALEDI